MLLQCHVFQGKTAVEGNFERLRTLSEASPGIPETRSARDYDQKTDGSFL